MMKRFPHRAGLPRRQGGALIVVTLVILLVVSMLGMATMDTSGLEMRMASNSRDQQQAFEAAEYTLSWVQNDITGRFTDSQIGNAPDCGSVCFESTCSGGYCFQGESPTNPATCELDAPADDIHTEAALWEAGSGRHQTLTVPDIGVTARYIVEYRCYTALDPAQEFDDETNYARMFRITAYVVGPAGRGRSMLRAVIKDS